MRVTAAFSRLLRLKGVWITAVRFEPDRVVVEVALRRQRLLCPLCGYSTRARRDTRPVDSVWRHLDLGTWRLEIHARRRRLDCPVHGVRAEAVPFARPDCGFTRDFETLVAWLATRTDKTTVQRLVRVDWATVGRIIERVRVDELDPDRLDGLFEIGIDEVSWRKQHRYLTLVVDHQRRRVVWGTAGAGAGAADEFFAALDPDVVAGGPAGPPAGEIHAGSPRPRAPVVVGDRASELTAVSMDMGPGYAKSVREHAPNATICIDNYHVVQLANQALDEVRRGYWNELRRSGDKQAARRFKDARWALLKRPENLTDKQAQTHRELKRAGGDVWRAYTLKEALRGLFAPGLDLDDVTILIDRFLSRAARSRLDPFVRLGQTIKKHHDGILAAIRLGITQGRTEAINNKVRLITRRAYGFHSAHAALALVILTCGPINLKPPHEQPSR